MRTIKKGSRGSYVKVLQMKLGITVDGFFGTDTEKAVIAYQKSHGLTPDGIVGNYTWESLGYRTTSREIDEIIIHCSATKEGVPFSIDQIDASHKARNFSSYIDLNGRTRYIGYHFVIMLDGTIQSCRPIDKIGCHASGHNARSIGICYIGGLDSKGKVKDTRTPAQKVSLITLIKDLKNRYPSIDKVIGHRDTSPDLNGNGVIEPNEYIKGCPCFDAIPEYKDL
ncbi:MAG: N-acetylmuramoyl-L-alanine amidase [Lepagella sp.]